MSRSASARAQRGATLVTVMILLVVMTLLGLVSIRGALMEERGAASLYDRGLSFQSAEAGLRAGEALAATRPTRAAGTCSAGVCGFAAATAAPRWEDGTGWAAALTSSVELGGHVARPQYFVELLADQVPPRGSCTTSGDVSESTCTGAERRYRITARSTNSDRATVVLQSIFAVP